MNRADLITYAKAHRLRTRNLHDGGPVGPGRLRRQRGAAGGVRGGAGPAPGEVCAGLPPAGPVCGYKLLLPPSLSPSSRGIRSAYTGDVDRLGVIIGRYGYVTGEGDGLGWCLRLDLIGAFSRARSPGLANLRPIGEASRRLESTQWRGVVGRYGANPNSPFGGAYNGGAGDLVGTGKQDRFCAGIGRRAGGGTGGAWGGMSWAPPGAGVALCKTSPLPLPRLERNLESRKEN